MQDLTLADAILDRLVAAHALEADSVRRALDAGADVLAHTPRDPLPADLIARVEKGGLLVLSGILVTQRETVLAAYSSLTLEARAPGR